MASGNWPRLADVRSWLRLAPDPGEDAVIDQCRLAAIAYGIERTTRALTLSDGTVTYVSPWPSDTTILPDALFQACAMDAGRIYRRRDSLDGTIAWGDMGVVRVGRADPDVERLYGLYAPLVFS
jgi:hypothetical protein